MSDRSEAPRGSLPGYVASTSVWTSASVQIDEAVRERDGLPVVAKTYAIEDRLTLARVRHELERRRSLALDGVLAPLCVEPSDGGLVVISERATGVDLESLAGAGPLAVDRFLPIAMSVTATLAAIHERGLLHDDLRPATLHVDVDTGRVRVGGPAIPALIDHERRARIEAGELLTVCPYLAPEVGGRRRSAVDVRSDLYSLGASFHRLLSGRPPFVADSVHGLWQSRVTRMPRAIAGLAPMLAAIVARLLATAPHDRYPSAVAVLRELGRLADARAKGDADPEPAVGEHDWPTTLLFSFQPHAREPDLRTLVGELAGVEQSAATRVVVIDGPAGVGKSTLIDSFEVSVATREGLFGVGRVEPDGPPHAALFEALDGIAEQLRGHSSIARRRWQQHLRERVGGVAAVIVERAPGWASLFGELDPAPKLEPEAARRRYQLALERLLSAIGERAPLALALDGMEAASADDRALLDALLAAKPPVLLLFACTDRGLEAQQPSVAWLAGLAARDVAVTRLGVEPLLRRDLVEWLGQSFGVPPQQLASLDVLATALERRSRRIAGRVRCLLERLFERERIKPSPSGWIWDSAALDDPGIALDGAGWIVGARERLADGDLELLELAALIGERFATRVLARASGRSPDDSIAALARLEQVGLLVASGDQHRFAWDVHAAARAGIDPERRRHGLLAIAAAIDEQRPGASEAIAALVVRAGGVEVLTQLVATERSRLARHCAVAGRAALASGAWDTAHRWLALALIEPGPDEVSLACDHAIALAVAGLAERADAMFEPLLERPLPLSIHAELVAARVRSLTWQARNAEALDLGLAALARCGLHVRRSVGAVAIGLAIGRAYLAGRNLDLDALLAAEPVDSDVVAQLVIADAVAEAAYLESPRLFVLLATLRARRIAQIGLHRVAPVAIAHLAVVVGGVLRRTDEAARLCDLALELCERVDGGAVVRPRVESSTMLVIWPLVRPFTDSVDGLLACQRGAVELGDVGVASIVATGGLGLCFHAGVLLPELQTIGRLWRAQLEPWSSVDVRATVDAWLELLAVLIDPRRESSELIADLELANVGVGAPVRYALALNGALALWLAGERDEAAARMEPLIDGLERELIGSWQIPPGVVMLAIVANHRAGDDPSERRAATERIRLALSLARRFARSSWANYGAHVELITGELERVRGRDDRAVLAYERARELASDSGHACMQAIACDRLANLALATGRRATARGAAVTAIAALRRWGAEAAARQLERAYAELLAVVAPSARAPVLASPARRRMALDPSTVLDVMHGISDELRLEEVVARVIDSAVSSSGDERAVLLLAHDGVIGLVAEGDGEAIREFVDDPVPLAEAGDRVPRTIVEHALETGAVVVIDDASTDLRFAGDPYLQGLELGSLLCMPIAGSNDRIGALLLEHRRASGGFPPERVEILRILLTQAASAVSHARLFEALQRSEALFRSLVDGVPDMISLLDLQGRVEFINHLVEFTQDPATLIGVDSTLMMDPVCGPQWRAALDHVGTTGEPRELEIRANFPGGVTRWYSIRLNALEFGGKIRKLLSIATDITDRKLAEADKLRLEAQLRQQQRLESVGTLASGVAHEINNPVQGIMNYADLLLARPGDKEQVIDFAAEILAESERIATIVRNLLAFSRQEAEHTPELCSVYKLIDATLSLIRAVVRKDDIELRIDVPEQLHDIRCRYQQIQQILMNLVANARDALNEREDGVRKTIEIRARDIERDGRSWVRISVEDCGAGIPEHVRARIFDPFFTTKGRDQGTGLGLAVSHGIAVEHGGELRVETELGVGSTFHLELPAAERG